MKQEAINTSEFVRQLPRQLARSTLLPPLVVLLAILTITLWPWQNARQNLQSNYQRSIDEQIQTVGTDLINRFKNYENALKSAIGLVQADPDTSKSEWHTFIESSGVISNNPGIQSVGYSRVISYEQIPVLNEMMASQGKQGYSVHPIEPVKNTYAPVLFLHPETNNNNSAFGFDVYSNPTRRIALDRARDTGKAALTSKVALVQDRPTRDQFGFVLYVPYYSQAKAPANMQERQASIAGFVSAGFRNNTLFSQVVEDKSNKGHYSIKIYDNKLARENLLYESSNSEAINRLTKTHKVTKPLTIAGTNWVLDYTFDDSKVVSSSAKNTPMYILLVGVVTAFLVFFILLMVLKTRSRELQLQKEQEVDLAKDELLSLASHQMRTPATGVKQYLGMVLQGFTGKLPSQQKAMLERAYTSNERQLQVINQVLHLAKLESGRIVLAKHETNLSDLVRDVVDEQRKEAESHGHTVKLQLPKRPIKLEVDSHMLRMAIENILSNAIKYTLKSGVISVRLKQTTSNVLVAIKDSGIGIEPKDKAQIFKQFSRLYNEKAAQVSGTGVGLYLADQLVKLHGGTITLESTLGKGSEFTISLPR
jgi:signal transduction histidine kinase/sensor domain CHASE-containing protein